MATRVLRPLEWTLPPRAVRREIIARLPDMGTDKPPLLFVHGAYHSAWVWDEHWMPEAADRGWPCYALSLRGHGGSEGGEKQLGKWTLRDYAHDVLEAARSLDETPVLVGHSMGALVVQRVLDDFKARAGVLVAPFPPHGGYRTLARIARRHPTDLARLAAFRSLPPRREYFFSDRISDEEAQDYLARIKDESGIAQLELALPRRRTPEPLAPVLVLGAEEDALVDPVDVVRTGKAYGTQARMFRGMGHDMMLDAGWRAPLEIMLRWLEDEIL